MPAIANFAEQSFQRLAARAPAPLAERAVVRQADALTLGAGDAAASARTRQAAYQAANQRLLGKYPTLDGVLKDPDAFVADLQRRFAAQKVLTPGRPQAFDFSDYGMPLLKTWRPMLDQETAKLQAQLAAGGLGDRAVTERRLALAHLQDIKAVFDRHLASGRVDYQSLQELSFFSSRAMGRFDTPALGLKKRLLLEVDRFLQGHKSLPIVEERARFKRRDMTIFDANSPVGGFKVAQGPFEQAFKNRQTLDMILLPTSEPLGYDIFKRLANYNIFLMGVTAEPLAADGFVRPSSDFWVHDARHNSAIYEKRSAYIANHHVTPEQFAALQKQSDVWQQDLLAAEASIQDPELAGAVKFFEFNYHHDRGYPVLPSVYEKPEASTPTPRALYMALKLGDQAVEFKAPGKTIDRAYAFLRAFWMPRLGEEKAILASKG